MCRRLWDLDSELSAQGSGCGETPPHLPIPVYWSHDAHHSAWGVCVLLITSAPLLLPVSPMWAGDLSIWVTTVPAVFSRRPGMQELLNEHLGEIQRCSWFFYMELQEGAL